MPGSDETQTPSTNRYSFRTRTPAKPEPVPSQQTPARKRSRPTGAPANARKSAKRAASSWASLRKTKTTSKRAAAKKAPVKKTKKRVAPRKTAKAVKEERESASEAENEGAADIPEGNVQADAAPAENAEATVVSGPSKRGRKPSTKRGEGSDMTPAMRSWQIRRLPINMTKHDPFVAEHLIDVGRILQTIPVSGTPNEELYEMIKMSDCLKMCGYELGVVDLKSQPFDEIYRLLSWSVHAGGPSTMPRPSPPISDSAKTILLKVVAAIGRRIREETKDMAAYHRRHANRKLMLAQKGELLPQDDKGIHRRNPLKIPAPLVDIWKVPYKKNTDEANNE